MKKFLVILGGIFGVLLVLLMLLMGYGFSEGPKLDAESKAWVDDIVPKIVTTWDAKILIENSSPELLASATEGEFMEFMSGFNVELGKLLKYGESKGEAGIHINNTTKTTTAEYAVLIECEKGEAQVLIRGIKREGDWKILNFHVNLPKMPSSAQSYEETEVENLP